MANSSTKNRHLSLDDRIEIQSCLNCGNSFKAIAKRIGKDPTTISKEVKRNILVKPTSAVRKDKDGQTIVAICPNLLKPPFVCNACRKKNTQCVFDKYWEKVGCRVGKGRVRSFFPDSQRLFSHTDYVSFFSFHF